MYSSKLGGRWNQICIRAKEYWDKLVDRNLDRLNGERDQIAVTLQGKYAYARVKAGEKLDRLLKDFD